MNLFFAVFCLIVLLPNSMSKLIHNRCKLHEKTQVISTVSISSHGDFCLAVVLGVIILLKRGFSHCHLTYLRHLESVVI